MKLKYCNDNLFNRLNDFKDKKYLIVHCISSDFKLGKGFAKQLDDNMNTKNELQINHRDDYLKYPNVILTNENIVANLVTKEKFYDKPTYNNLKICIQLLKNLIKNNYDYILMPKIGCGLDKLNWSIVKNIIEEYLSYCGTIIIYDIVI